VPAGCSRCGDGCPADRTGERSTSVRIIIHRARSTGLETFDLPVSNRVDASDLAGQAIP